MDEPNNSRPGNWFGSLRNVLLIFLVLGIFVVVLLVPVGLYIWFTYAGYRDQFFLEVAKALLQILVVIVAGGVITVLVRHYDHQHATQERDRDERRRQDQNEDEFRKETLGRLNRAYVDTKRARRLLRATAFSPSYYRKEDGRTNLNLQAQVQLQGYDRQMQRLNNAQLDLEVLEKDVRTSADVFQHYGTIVKSVANMADYLDFLVTEYEWNRGDFRGNPPSKSVRELKQLGSFLNSRRESFIFGPFVKHYQIARGIMQEDILAHGKRDDGTSWGPEGRSEVTPDAAKRKHQNGKK